jgi:hypothetical protein
MLHWFVEAGRICVCRELHHRPVARRDSGTNFANRILRFARSAFSWAPNGNSQDHRENIFIAKSCDSESATVARVTGMETRRMRATRLSLIPDMKNSAAAQPLSEILTISGAGFSMIACIANQRICASS